MQYGNFFAVLIALGLFFVFAEVDQARRDRAADPHSPSLTASLMRRVKRLFKRDTSHETPLDTRSETTDLDVYDWGYIDREAVRASEGDDDLEDESAEPPIHYATYRPEPKLTDLEKFVKTHMSIKTRSIDICAIALRDYGASRSTVYRAMTKVRDLL